MTLEELTILAIAAFTLSLVYTRFLIKLLGSRQIFDRPNERSNHAIPTVRGGGIAIVDTILSAGIYLWFVCNGGECDYLHSYIPALIGLFILASVSLVDDIRTLPASWRFLMQIMVVAISTYYLTESGELIFQGLFPLWLDKVATCFLWLWFINLYNFMDGIDGITGSQTITICVGLIIILVIKDSQIFFPVMVLAATAGFLVFNWHPAKIFLGDVGSVSLGFIVGFMLFTLAQKGYWAEAIILPAYYLADSTYTLLKRLLRGEKIWQAHSEHFYQQAVRSGRSHSLVVKTISIANLLLVILAALVAMGQIGTFTGLILAGVVATGLLSLLKNI